MTTPGAAEVTSDEIRARLEKENTILRGLIQHNKDWKCTYGYKIEHMAQCPSGFPGCGCADDLMLGEDEAARDLHTKIASLQSQLSAAQQERDLARGTLRAREVLSGALGMNMDETVVEACRRTSESFKRERDEAISQLSAAREECAKICDEIAQRLWERMHANNKHEVRTISAAQANAAETCAAAICERGKG